MIRTGHRGASRTAALVLSLAVAAGCATVAAPTALAVDPPTLTADTIRKDLTFAESRLAATSSRLATTAYPVRTGSTGAWTTVGATDWTSGFFPGALWQAYARTKDPVWQQRAEAWQRGVEVNKTNNSSHDVGFQINNSFGKDAALTGDATAAGVVRTAAGTLATRYNPTVGAFRSWDAITDTTKYQVIMDNMMNLELMFQASAQGGKPEWATMAASHARVTARDFFRPDGGSWHVVNYDQKTGTVISKYTHQGYSNDSTWSRGEAWAIHGFTTSYRYTNDPQFLATAEKAADYFLAHLPADKVPYWDFNLPSTTGQPRDTSAAAVAASGLVDLSKAETDPTRATTYLNGARDILASLSTPAYLAQGTSNQATLLHGTQNKPNNQYDTGIMFGDYYFAEALQRYAAATNVDVSPASDPITAWYATLGGSRSALGLPSSGLRDVTGGRAQDFTGGSIYWSATSAAHAVLGAINTKYVSVGGPTGRLGFPTGEQVAVSGGTRSDFQHGSITYNTRTRTASVTYR